MDPTTPNQKPEGDLKPAQNPTAEGAWAQNIGAGASSDQFLFFNVMPKNASAQEELISPTLKVADNQPPPAVTSSRLKDFLKKYRLYLIIGVVIAVLAVVSYVVFVKTGEIKEENLLNTHVITTPTVPEQTSQPAATTTPTATATTPEDWQAKYFKNKICADLSVCGDQADPDHDGLVNIDEFTQGTDPNNPDSDGDGLADGDEVHVFGSDPLKDHSGVDSKYADSDYVKNGYDLKTDKKMPIDQVAAITSKMQRFGLHEPTISTLKDILISVYHFTSWMNTPPVVSTTTPASLPLPAPTSTLPILASSTPATTTALSGFDRSVEAAQSRDAQRSATIQNIGIALIKYHGDTQNYPATSNFLDMFNTIKPYLKVATRPDDPVNKDPYVYIYQPSADGTDFTLSFYSEVAGQIIKKHAADAQKDLTNEQASIYDDQRKTDLETIKTALLLYSNANVAGTQDYVFPAEDKYKTALVPTYIPQLPKDPKTGQDYEYQVADTFDTFTVRAMLDSPAKGTTGYLCNQDECRVY